MFKKIFLKIFFSIIIVFIIQTLNIQKINAYILENNACAETNVTKEIYVLTTNDLNGFFPLCFYDADTSNNLNIKLDNPLSTTNESAKIQSSTASGNTVGATTNTFKGGGTTTVE